MFGDEKKAELVVNGGTAQGSRVVHYAEMSGTWTRDHATDGHGLPSIIKVVERLNQTNGICNFDVASTPLVAPRRHEEPLIFTWLV